MDSSLSISPPIQVKIWFQNRRMKWRNSKERELLATGTGSRDQTLPNKNNPNPDLSDTVCDRNPPSVSPGSTSSTHSDVKLSAGTLTTTTTSSLSAGDPRGDDTVAVVAAVGDKELRNDGMYSEGGGGGGANTLQTSFLANIYSGKLGYPSIKSSYKVSPAAAGGGIMDYDDDSSDSSMNSDEEINVTWFEWLYIIIEKGAKKKKRNVKLMYLKITVY